MDAPMELPKALELKPISSDKNYAEASAAATQIRSKLNDLIERERELTKKIALARLPLDSDEFSDRVEQVLSGNMEPDRSLPSIESASLERSQIRGEIEVLKAALFQQREKVNAIVSKLSIAAAEQVSAEHKAAVSAIANALDALKRAASNEDKIRRQVRQLGYDECLPSFHVPEVLRFRSPNWHCAGFSVRVADYLK